MKLQFEKTITRDWSLLYSEIWFRAYMVEGKRVLGWGFTDNIYEGEHEMVTVYRAPSELLGIFKEKVIEQLDKNPNWIKEQADILLGLTDQAWAVTQDLKDKSLESYTTEELLKLAHDFFELNVRLSFPFVVMLWFPIGIEADPRKSQYQEAIDVAIDARSKSEKVGPPADTLLRRLAAEALKRQNLDQKYARYISFEDLTNFFKNKTSFDMGVIQKREKYFILTLEGILVEKVGDYLTRRGFELVVPAIDANIKEIKGQVGYKGKVQGKVRIIKNKNLLDTLVKGEILVTTMTSPDFAPALQTVAGIITDEGGITCHAAIIAREMKIPCIIGTKIATQALKDGDLVELDAETGVVTILST